MKKNRISSARFADTKPHYELLDGLRGVAALLVLWYHVLEGYAFAATTNGEGDGTITILNHAHLGVDFFFMLSGFVIGYAYDDRWQGMSLADFFKRRLIRLHPMLVMGAVIGVASFFFAGCERWDGTTTSCTWVAVALVLTMFMIPALPGAPYEVRGNGEIFPLNGPAWSLFFEYIGNILYALFLRRLPAKMLALLVALLGCVYVWFFAFDLSGYDNIGVGWTFDAVNFPGGLLRMLFPFTVGMLLSRTCKLRKIKGAFVICSVMLLAVFAVPYIPSCCGVSLNGIYEVVCVALVFPVVVYMGACGKCDDNFTGRINKFLGDISYPLYIVHYPIMYIFYAWLIKKHLYTFGETWGVSLAVITASILLAYAVLKLYDEPVRRLLARRFLKKQC